MRLSGHIRARLKRIPIVKAGVQRLRTLNPHEFGFPPGHYYSPIPSVKELRTHEHVIWRPPPSILPGIDLNEAAQLLLLERLAAYAGTFPFSAHPQPPLRYWTDNEYFAFSDGLILYSLLHHLQSQHIIEVGSGYSSALMLDTRDLSHQTFDCTFIEPYPERLLSLLKPEDHPLVTLVRQPVQDVPLSTFAQLAANDILFIDSSHVSKAGSDLNFLLFEVLPTLADGVYIHLHDVIYPFEYPKIWALKGRAWNEAYLMRAFLQYNQKFEIALWPHFLSLFHLKCLQDALPYYPAGTGGSLWLKKRDAS